MSKVYIFGAGISGATMARLCAEKGHDVVVYEKKGYIGGNCFDYKDYNRIMVHKFGPHIFHTSNEEVYSFFTRFCKLNGYKNEVLVNINDELFPLPFNFESIDQKYSEKEAKEIKEKLTNLFPGKLKVSILDIIKTQDNQLKSFADFVYANIYANYTSKMWGINIKDIDPNTINRVGIVLGYERSYFPDDKYQGLPIKGYTNTIKRILNHEKIKVILNSKQDFLKIEDKKTFINNELILEPIFYCGTIDELFNYKYGQLPFRSLFFQFETIYDDSFQESAIVNYPAHPSMTRITEYKKMSLQKVDGITTISREFPGEFDSKSKDFSHRYYPISNQKNNDLYEKYLQGLKNINNFHTLGRLAEYKYYDMDDAIQAAINKFKKIF